MSLLIIQTGTTGNANPYRAPQRGVAVDPSMVIALSENYYATDGVWQTTIYLEGTSGLVLTVEGRRMDWVIHTLGLSRVPLFDKNPA